MKSNFHHRGTEAQEKIRFFFVVKKICLLCVSVSLWLTFVSFASAQEAGGQRPAAYLELGAGGAPQAMGGAAAALRNDVSCAYWNPAGLTALRGVQIEDQYTFLSQGQSLNYFGVANGYRDWVFYGLSVFYYSAGEDLEARSGPSLNPDSIFGDVELTFLTSLAFRLNPRWSIGGNLKIFDQTFGTYSAFGFGEDLGIQYRITKDTTLGFVVQDPFSLMSGNGDSDFFPPTFKAGIAHTAEDISLKGDFDLEWSGDLGFRPRFGVEYRPLDLIALRGGCWVGISPPGKHPWFISPVESVY